MGSAVTLSFIQLAAVWAIGSFFVVGVCELCNGRIIICWSRAIYSKRSVVTWLWKVSLAVDCRAAAKPLLALAVVCTVDLKSCCVTAFLARVFASESCVVAPANACMSKERWKLSRGCVLLDSSLNLLVVVRFACC